MYLPVFFAINNVDCALHPLNIALCELNKQPAR